MTKDPLANPADRRTSRRNSVQVRLELSDKKLSFSGRTVDVSRGGLFAAASELRPVGTLLRIKVIGPKGDPIYAVGVVVRTFASIADGGVSEQGNNTMGLAIALTSTSESWDLFWDDVSAVDTDEDEIDGLDDLEDEPS
jgi:PilZ domain